MKCPYCGSEHVQYATSTTSRGFSLSNSCCGTIIFGPLGLLCGLCGMKSNTKEFWICQDCYNKFTTEEGKKHIEDERQEKLTYEQYKKELDELLPKEGGINEVNQNKQKASEARSVAQFRLNEAFLDLTIHSDPAIRAKAKVIHSGYHYWLGFLAFVGLVALVMVLLFGHKFSVPLLIFTILFIQFFVAALFVNEHLRAKLETSCPEYKKAADDERAATNLDEYYESIIKKYSFIEAYEKKNGTQ